MLSVLADNNWGRRGSVAGHQPDPSPGGGKYGPGKLQTHLVGSPTGPPDHGGMCDPHAPSCWQRACGSCAAANGTVGVVPAGLPVRNRTSFQSPTRLVGSSPRWAASVGRLRARSRPPKPSRTSARANVVTIARRSYGQSKRARRDRLGLMARFGRGEGETGRARRPTRVRVGDDACRRSSTE